MVVPAILAALSCATLAQAVCDDILPRQLVPALLLQQVLLFLNTSFFSLCSIQKLEDVSAGYFAARYDRGFSNRWW